MPCRDNPVISPIECPHLPLQTAKMQDLDWDDLKHALAVARTGSLAEAARTLGVNETTVARRVRTLEAQIGAPVFQRG
ncbi:MAG: LysR family transcriptional regulator, partial [Alphaproteobacteria bacterium]